MSLGTELSLSYTTLFYDECNCSELKCALSDVIGIYHRIDFVSNSVKK